MVTSKIEIPSDLALISSSIHSSLASQSGINRISLCLIIMLIVSFVCMGFAAGFIAIIYRAQIAGVFCLVTTPFGAYLMLSFVMSHKRRLNMIVKYLEINSPEFQTKALEHGYHVSFRISDEASETCEPTEANSCSMFKGKICLIIEYSSILTSSAPKMGQKNEVVSGRRENQTTIKEIEPEVVTQGQEFQTKELVDHDAEHKGSSKLSKLPSSNPKQTSQNLEEEDQITDRRPLIISCDKNRFLQAQEKGTFLEDCNTQQPRSIAQLRFKDMSRRSFSQGVFVVSNVSHGNEIVKIKPKNIALGKKASFLVSKRISGLDQSKNREDQPQNPPMVVKIVTPNQSRMHSKPRIKTLVATGRQTFKSGAGLRNSTNTDLRIINRDSLSPPALKEISL